MPGKSHGQRSLVGCSPWGHEESDTTERLLFHFSLSCIGEGNGNPLQCSCLENPRDSGVWWAAIYGVAQSQTRLKRLSSSNISTPQGELVGKSSPYRCLPGPAQKCHESHCPPLLNPPHLSRNSPAVKLLCILSSHRRFSPDMRCLTSKPVPAPHAPFSLRTQ